MEMTHEVAAEERPTSRESCNPTQELWADAFGVASSNNSKTPSETNLGNNNTPKSVADDHLDYQATQIEAIDLNLNKSKEEENEVSVQEKQNEEFRPDGSVSQVESIINPTLETSEREVTSSKTQLTCDSDVKTGIMRSNKKSLTLNITTSNLRPSAALKCLESARWLTSLDPSIYPPSIKSPNPCLNQDDKGSPRSFKYDKEFLLQFKNYFVEKPCMEFESRISALYEETSKSPKTGSKYTFSNSPRCDTFTTINNEIDRVSLRPASTQKPNYIPRWDTYNVKINERYGNLGSTQRLENRTRHDHKNSRNSNKTFGMSSFSWGDNRRPVDNITKEEFESITRQWREFKS